MIIILNNFIVEAGISISHLNLAPTPDFSHCDKPKGNCLIVFSFPSSFWISMSDQVYPKFDLSSFSSA
jgi:hypothetical protein